MTPVLGKIELADRDRDLVLHLTEALGALAQEIKRYNDTGEATEVIEVPTGAGDYEFREGQVRHKWPHEVRYHTHPTPANFLQCLTDAEVL